ncbi:unnamed protein product [Durusdinium trenchii]|uniref:Uncharacterized protein n=1 Tax=Durusdinium trenchii TaxID=1381693 RepID=A0ABP0PH45_9DINO
MIPAALPPSTSGWSPHVHRHTLRVPGISGSGCCPTGTSLFGAHWVEGAIVVAMCRRCQTHKESCLRRNSLSDWPTSVSGYAVRPIIAKLPHEIGSVAALVVDEEAECVDEDIPEWVPAEWLSPVMGDSGVSDVYGAIGVWPAAFVAAEVVLQKAPKGKPFSCLELGCGAGFPSLVAGRLGAERVYALDSEQLTLDLLQAAFERQGTCGRLVPLLGDASKLPQDLLASVSLIIVSDLLYSVELGKSLGWCLGRWVIDEGRQLVLTDGGRSGRPAFLEAFREASSSDACFEDVPVPDWAPQKGDFFDGTSTQTVGLLRCFGSARRTTRY